MEESSTHTHEKKNVMQCKMRGKRVLEQGREAIQEETEWKKRSSIIKTRRECGARRPSETKKNKAWETEEARGGGEERREGERESVIEGG